MYMVVVSEADIHSACKCQVQSTDKSRCSSFDSVMVTQMTAKRQACSKHYNDFMLPYLSEIAY